MLIYQYSGGLNGFLCAVFRAYGDKALPDLITDGTISQPPFCSQIVRIVPEEEKALRVERGIHARLGMAGLRQLGYAYASCDLDRNRKLFYWILSVFKYGSEVQKRYHDGNVMEFCDMTARVTLEIGRTASSLSFADRESGLHYATCTPEHNVLPFLMPQLLHRFGKEKFLVLDSKRNLYGISNGTEWKVLSSGGRLFGEQNPPEEIYQRLWQEYFRAIALAARENARLQDGFLPCRYRAFLTEFYKSI